MGHGRPDLFGRPRQWHLPARSSGSGNRASRNGKPQSTRVSGIENLSGTGALGMTTVMQAKPEVLTAPRAALDPAYKNIRDLVYKASGIYQPDEKLYLLADGCGRRIKQLGEPGVREYWNRLSTQQNREGELRLLLNELTIGETCLFRSQAQLDALRKVILPELVADRTRQMVKRLRVWSAGCSTGEEPYTLAMTLLEESEGLLKGWQIDIAATDLNDNSIETA